MAFTKLVKEVGFKLREGTYDKGIASEIERNYEPLRLGAHDRVLDLGAHIGLSVYYALRCGVDFVVGLEPHLGNFNLMLENIQNRSRLFPIYGAAVRPGYPDPWIDLYLNRGKQQSTHSTVQMKGRRHSVTVPAYQIDRLLRAFNCNVLKVDIEGAEYETFPTLMMLPHRVKKVALELHLGRKEWRESCAPALIKWLAVQGFVPRVKPNLDDQRGTNGVWHR